MKALTIAQPYAALIMGGHKTIETRPAPPNGPMRPKGVRGLPGCSIDIGERIAIHASAQRPDDRRAWDSGHCFPEVDALPDMWSLRDECELGGGTWGWDGPLGAVVGTARIIDAVEMTGPKSIADFESLPERTVAVVLSVADTKLSLVEFTNHSGQVIDDFDEERAFGDFALGRWAWLLADVEAFDDPVLATGKQGVWRWEP